MSFGRRSVLLLPLAALPAACGRKPVRSRVLPGASVLALGDSMTFGTGATPQTCYPPVLARLSGWAVVNAGVPGDTSAGALARLPQLLHQHSPQLVLVSIGGNDFLRRLPTVETRANIRGICQRVMAGGAQLLLIGMPEAGLFAALTRNLKDHPLYEEVSAELKVPLHTGGWAEVLNDPALRSDPIHANADGYARFAHGLLATARVLGWWVPAPPAAAESSTPGG